MSLMNAGYGTVGVLPRTRSDDRRDDEQDDRHEEDDLRDLDGETCDAAESEHRGDQRYDEKCQSPTKHGECSSKFTAAHAASATKRPAAKTGSI